MNAQRSRLAAILGHARFDEPRLKAERMLLMSNATVANDVPAGEALRGMALARVLKRLRGNRNRKAVSDGSGVPYDTLASWESGKVATISADDQLQKLASYYGTTPEAIVAEVRGDQPQKTVVHDPPPLPARRPPNAVEQAFLDMALDAMRGPGRTMIQEAIQLAAAINSAS